MKSHVLTAVLVLAALSACRPAEPNAVTSDDVPDLADLTTPDADSASAAAAQVGDPATLLLAAHDEAEQVRGDAAGVLDFLKEATARAPDAHGTNVLGQQFGRWDLHDNDTGNSVHVIAIKTEENRVRIVVQGENADGLSLPIMTGVFVKAAPHVGGGRFHVSFSNYSDLFKPEGQGADGSMHFFFANVRPDLHGRRVAYVNVVDRTTPDADPKSFGADLVRLVGVGGRFRSIYATDMIEALPGLEAIGMRVAWLAGVGGRADMVVATQANGGQILAVAHECWDPAGLRTAYADTVPNNDNDAKAGPDEGDLAHCHDLADSTVDGAQVQRGDADTDPDLDGALADSGASDVSDDDASDDSVPDSDPAAP